MKKSNIVCFVAGAMLFGTVGVFAGQYTATENPFPIKLNGADVSMEGYNINDSTYFKLRDIAYTLGGFTVDFNDNTIQISKDEYVHNNNNATPEYSYEEFELLFAQQEYILDNDIKQRLESSDWSTVGMAEATYDSKIALLQKAYDIANLYLTQYDSSRAITMDELEELCQSRYDEIIAENESVNPAFWTGGTIDTLTQASCAWDAAKDILKQYFYELYEYIGTVEVTLTVG